MKGQRSGTTAAVKPKVGREAQRRRTRDHILLVVKNLLRNGGSPSMAEIAAETGVARRTLYLHFTTLEHLLLDARLGLLSESAIDEVLSKADQGKDVVTRVLAMIDAICANAQETLPLGRSLIRLTVETAGNDGEPTRGYRRIRWIERALEPLRDQLKGHEFERLVSALAVIIGWESMIVLHDVRGLSDEEALEATRWTARSLISATLQDAATVAR